MLMKRFFTNRFVLFALGTLFVILLWVICSLMFDKNGAIFPNPVLTMEKFGTILGESYTYKCLGYTFLRMLMGFSLSFIVAVLFGVIAGNNEHIYQFLKPLIVVIKSVPTVALVFLFLVMINAKNAPIFVVFVICFPILYEGVVGGIKNVPTSVINAAKVDGANCIKTTLFIKFPLAIPYIIVGMASSFALSFKIEIMAEVITGYTRNGLGSVIHFTQVDDPTNMAGIFAYSLLAIIIMLLVSLLGEIIKIIFKKHNIVVLSNN